MNKIKTYFFLFFFSIFVVSSDVEEVIVQGDWRDTKLVEEDSSVLVLTSKEINSAPIKNSLPMVNESPAIKTPIIMMLDVCPNPHIIPLHEDIAVRFLRDCFL